jgi:nicotinate-nucleotide adenylyltransferase
LLGGSFNPAHGGHLHVSLTALRRLDLDEVWWLVSPQNPLKPTAGMAPFAERFAQAEALAAPYPRIKITDIETRLGTTYTADTLPALQRRYPRVRFVWLMGGDNLAQIPHWQNWPSIFRAIPVAVFDRPATSLKAISGKAAQRFARARVPVSAARRLAEMRPPAWVFFHTRLDPRSATQIRAARQLHSTNPAHSTKEQQTDVISQTAPSQTSSVTPFPSRRRARPSVDPAQLLARIVTNLEDGKAEDIVTIDLAGKTAIADYMVIATGRSSRQVAALTDHLERELKGGAGVSVEGKAQGDWVLVDAGDVIVHIFRPEIRAHYNLEKMWGDAAPHLEAVPQEAG